MGDEDGVEIPSELRQYLENEEDPEQVRAIAHYDRDDYIFELDDALREEYADAELKAIIDDFRLQDVGQDQQEGLYSIGSLYCSIRAFDSALLLHFIAGDGKGTIVSLQPEAAPRLTQLVDDILKILAEGSEQEIDELPSWSVEGN